MRTTWRCLVVLAVFARPAAAEESKSVLWQRSPRKLQNATNVSQTPIRWDALVFSGDGKALVGAGDRPQPVSSSSRRGPPRTDRAGLIEVWDLKTYRPSKAGYTFLTDGRYADPGLRLHIALRVSENGKVIYGNLQANDFRTDVLANVVSGWESDVKARLEENTGIYHWDSNEEYPKPIRALKPPTSVFFLGSHLSSDGRSVLLAAPEGLQNYAIQVQQLAKQPKQTQTGKKQQGKQTPQSKATKQPKLKKPVPPPPGVPKQKRLVASPRGTMIAAPSKFQSPSFFSADGSCFVAAEEGGEMVVWDVKAKALRCRTAAPPEGRAAVAAISRDCRRLFVASSSARGRIHIYDAANGQEVSQVGPLNAPVTNLSASADGESLAYCVGGRAYIHNSLTNSQVELPLAQDESLTCIAISADGRSAAGGGDGAVRLWETAPPQEAKLEQKPEASEAPLAALGPRRVTATSSKGEKQEMWLVRLTPSMALLRKTLGGRLLRVPAANGKITQLVADGATWELEAKSKRYAGPTVALPEQPAMDVAARPVSSVEENLHLLLGARRRLSALLSMIEEPGNDESIAEIRRQAERVERHLRGKPAPGSAIAEMYGELARAVDELRKSEVKRREVFDALNQQAIEISHKRAEAIDRAAADRLIGLGKILLGSMLTENKFVSAVNNPVGGFGPVYVQEVAIFPGLTQSGVLQVLGAEASSRQRHAQLRAAQELAKAETGKALLAALEQREAAIQRVQEGWQGVATRDFGLDADPPPPEDLPTKSRRAPDLQPLVDSLTERMHRDRGRTTRDDPFQFADVLFLKSLVKESAEADAENVFRQAREVAALVPGVPPGDVHNPDRALLLSLAAALVDRAVTLESGDCGPAEAYSEKAAYAVALLDRAVMLDPDNPAGRLGEQRALALAQCGRSEAALEQARQVVAKHPGSASARYLLARLECSAGNLNAGFEHLERALVKQGLRDLLDVSKRPEFPKNDDRFKELTKLKLRVGVVGKGRVAVLNAGQFPLYSVCFRLQYRGTKLQAKHPALFVTETGLQRLSPGQSYLLFTDPNVEIDVKAAKNGKPSQWSGGKLTVIAPQQGTEDFTLESASTGIVEKLLTPSKR